MTRTTDALAGLLSRLSLRGAPPTGAPQRRPTATEQVKSELAQRRRVSYAGAIDPTTGKPGRTLLPFTGALHPARCGATSTQTRSMKLGADVETVQDLAATLAVVTDAADYALVVYVAIPSWPIPHGGLPALQTDCAFVLNSEAARRGWDLHDLEFAIARAVLVELQAADACTTCNTSGLMYGTPKGQKDAPAGWVECTACRGTGRLVAGVAKRAKAVGIRESRFRDSVFQLAYDWLLRHLNARLASAAEAIQAARTED